MTKPPTTPRPFASRVEPSVRAPENPFSGTPDERTPMRQQTTAEKVLTEKSATSAAKVGHRRQVEITPREFAMLTVD